ncbi:predicted protein, partial [Nematostella vectensis]
MKYGPKKGKESVDSAALMDLIQNIRKDQKKEEKKARKYTPLDMLRGEKLRKWTLILVLQWFAVSLLSFGMFLFILQLAGNLYLNYLISDLIKLLKFPFAWFLLQ